MKAIWKYPANTVVSAPKDAKPVFVGRDPATGALTVWAEHAVENENTEVSREFYVYGTGHRVPDSATYLGSVIERPHVWHVYDRTHG